MNFFVNGAELSIMKFSIQGRHQEKARIADSLKPIFLMKVKIFKTDIDFTTKKIAKVEITNIIRQLDTLNIESAGGCGYRAGTIYTVCTAVFSRSNLKILHLAKFIT